MKSLVEYLNESLINEFVISPISSVVAYTRAKQYNDERDRRRKSSISDRSKVKFVHHVLDIMKDMTNDKENNFGIKFDEICGDLVGGLYHNSKTIEALESNGYLTKSSDGNYHILLTTTTHNNTVPCHISVDTNIVVERDTKMNDGAIQKKIKDAVEKLKKKTKLY